MSESNIKNMNEFSKLSGISRPTISKYFNDPNSVRSTTRAQIEEAIEKYNYRPNIFAMNFNRKSTKNVGIVVPYLADPYFAEIAREIERRLIDASYSPTVFSSHGDPDYEVELLSHVRSLKPACVLLAPIGRTSHIAEIENFCADVPTILFDRNIDGVGQAFVGSDNFSFVEIIMDYLIRTWEPPCFFEMRNPANPNAKKRQAAYITLMEKAGLEPQIIQVEGEGWAIEENGRNGALRLLEAGGFPTKTVLCSNDRLAIGLLSACYEKEIRVGRTEACALRVASMDGHAYSAYSCPSLTTSAHDYETLANAVFDALKGLIDAGGHYEDRFDTLIPAKLILRASA